MKIAIANKKDLDDTWIPFPTDPFMHPSKIRSGIYDLYEKDIEAAMQETEVCVVTMNPIVLNMITACSAKNAGPVCYEDVWVWHSGELVPLLSLHDSNWLSHFSLGDLFSRGDLIKP